MRLNTIKPAAGSNRTRKRLGRGIGSGHGKTAGRGHKGQKARSGGYHKVGFEGGQMPLQRRLPKRGFVSLSAHLTAEVRLSSLNKVSGEMVDLDGLKQAGVVPRSTLGAKVILAGKIERAVKLRGVGATKGARAAIEAAGGSVEAPVGGTQTAASSKKAAAAIAKAAAVSAKAAAASTKDAAASTKGAAASTKGAAASTKGAAAGTKGAAAGTKGAAAGTKDSGASSKA